MNGKGFAAGLVLAVTALAAPAGSVYKWTDKNGKVHYGDRPPEKEQQATRLNDSAVPMLLQERLRSLDPRFVITRIGGNLAEAYVCGQTSGDSENLREPRFPAAVESAQLGRIKTHRSNYSGEDHRYDANYDRVKCPSSDVKGLALWMYTIKFNPEAVMPYRAAEAAKN